MKLLSRFKQWRRSRPKRQVVDFQAIEREKLRRKFPEYGGGMNSKWRR